MLHRRLFGAAAMSALILASAPVSAEDLRDAIILAYQTNPDLLIQRAQQRSLDESVVQARVGYRPQVDASAGASYSRTWPEESGPFAANDETNSITAGLSVSQPLYTGGRVASGIDAAMAGVEQGRENLRAIEQQVMFAVIQSYADVLRDTEVLRIREENITVLNRQLEEANARFEVGEITRTDVAQAQARLAASQSDLAFARAQLSISRAAYTAVVGQSPGTLEPLPDLPVAPDDFDLALDTGLIENPSLRSALWAFEVAQAQVESARADYLPSAGLSASYGTGGTAMPFGLDDRQSLETRFSVSVPLFTGGLTASRVAQALEQANAAQIGVEAARRDVNQNVSSSYAQSLSAGVALTSTEEGVRAARIAAEGVRQEAQVGLRTTLDVLNQELELRNAEISYVNARRNRYVAQASLLAAIGNLEGPDLVGDVPAYDPEANFNRVRNRGAVPWEFIVETLDRTISLGEGGWRDEPNAPIDDELSPEVIRTAPR